MSTESAAVIVASITTVGSIAVAYISTRSHRETRRRLEDNTEKTEQVLHQVKNDHTTNLRDDLDKRFKGLHDKLVALEAAQAGLGGTVGRLGRDVKNALRHQREHAAASVLTGEQLHRRDDELAEELRQLREE